MTKELGEHKLNTALTAAYVMGQIEGAWQRSWKSIDFGSHCSVCDGTDRRGMAKELEEHRLRLSLQCM